MELLKIKEINDCLRILLNELEDSNKIEENDNRLIILLKEIKHLYKNVKKDQNDTSSHEIKQDLCISSEELDLLMKIQIEVEGLYSILNESKDSKLRDY